MNIVVLGATGFIGSHLVEMLLDSGPYTGIVVVTRRDPRVVLEERPWWRGRVELVRWRPHMGEPLVLPGDLLEEGYDLVNLAGERITGPWTPGKRRRIWESRVGLARRLANSLRSNPPRLLVQVEGTGVYGDRGEEEVSEDTPPGKGFLATLTKAVEEELQPLGDTGTRLIFARLGLVLGPGSPLLESLKPLLGLGLCPLLKGANWLPWVHVEDAVASLIYAAKKGLEGPLNIVAPNPVRLTEFFQKLCRGIGARLRVPIPGRLLSILGGRFAREALLASCKAVPKRLIDEGYVFKYPLLDQVGWKALLAEKQGHHGPV